MSTSGELLNKIKQLDDALTQKYSSSLVVNRELDRKLVSFQANKSELGHRWFKYKEGFSAALIRYLLEEVGISGGHILDPFAGSGTALFVASELGITSTGIELLPSSAESILVRTVLLSAERPRLAAAIDEFCQCRVWETSGEIISFPHLTITRDAFPNENEYLLGRYLYEVAQLDDVLLARVLRFAALCILEMISYTRKDGQYLRWDYRSGRRVGTKPFDKGRILGFTEAIVGKLDEIRTDLSLSENGYYVAHTLFDLPKLNKHLGIINLLIGSCLDLLPRLETGSFDGLITSPPYCNRYDYTRTYALELAMMGVNEDGIRQLRQSMLSCTVENRDKPDLQVKFANRYQAATEAWSSHETLTHILNYLEHCREEGSINNAGIPRMVRNYFAEMALVIFESARVLRPGAPLVMVNDNVRYQGAHVPVDLILSDIAQQAGFEVEVIWILPRGKGNSSQQMGLHGREEVRKCVYVWRRLRDELASAQDQQVALV